MVEATKLKSNFGKHKVPDELVKLSEFQEATGFEEISDGFNLCKEETTGLSSWSTEQAFLDSFIEFAEANGSGSFYALWLVNPKADLSKQPVVVFGDEGGVHVVADNLKAFLRLISFDSEPLVEWDEVSFHKDADDYEPSGDLDDYIEWLEDTYNLKPVESVDEILKPARRNHAKPLRKWLSRFIDDIEADDDEDSDDEGDDNDETSSKRRFEFEDGKSSKFWEIQLDGDCFTTWWGKIGTSGQSKELQFDSEEEAEKQYEKLVAEKTKKGYEEVGQGSGSARGSGSEDEDDARKPASSKVTTAKAPATPPPAKVTVSPKTINSSASSGAASGDRRRFEFQEGSSSKFWEIQLDGENLTTWWGKIGTAGQSKTLQLGSVAEGQKQYDKLVAEKTKKGYEEIG